MADYRMDCCGGFPSHYPWCGTGMGEDEWERQQADKSFSHLFTTLDIKLYTCNLCEAVVESRGKRIHYKWHGNS